MRTRLPRLHRLLRKGAEAPPLDEYHRTGHRDMRILRRIWGKFRHRACGICLVAVALIFTWEVSREDTVTKPIQRWGAGENAAASVYLTYEVSSDEENFVSHVTNELEKSTSRNNIHVELVNCHLRLWFMTSRYTVLTRSPRNLVEDDSFAQGSATSTKGRVVFLCYNSTSYREWNWPWVTKSNLPRRPLATDLLVVIYRKLHVHPSVSEQLQEFSGRFKGVMYVDASLTTSHPAPIKCSKVLHSGLSFGFRAIIEVGKRASTITKCLNDWRSEDERRNCPGQLSKLQELKTLLFVEEPTWNGIGMRSSSKFGPCFNMTLALDLNTVSPVNTPRMPVSVEDVIEAYAFVENVAVVSHGNEVLNEAVLCMMGLLGASVWLLGDSASADTLFTLLCTLTSSGGQLEAFKKRKTALAALSWIVGTLFFSLILVDAMTSSMTIPDTSQIPHLPDCNEPSVFSYGGKSYMIISDFRFWFLIVQSTFEVSKPIICGTPTAVDRIRKSFDFRNLHRTKVRDVEQKRWTAPLDSGKDKGFHCPLGGFATKCRVVGYDIDNEDWNDYAKTASRFDLFKDLNRRQLRHVNRRNKAYITRYYGPPAGKGIRSGTLSKTFSNLEPGRYALKESQDDFPTALISIGVGIALACFVLETQLSCISRGLTPQWKVPLRFPRCRASLGVLCKRELNRIFWTSAVSVSNELPERSDQHQAWTQTL